MSNSPTSTRCGSPATVRVPAIERHADPAKRYSARSTAASSTVYAPAVAYAWLVVVSVNSRWLSAAHVAPGVALSTMAPSLCIHR